MKEKKKKKIQILPDSTGLSIALLVLGFAEALFLMFLLALDIMPLKYMLILILLLLLIDALVVFLFTSKSKHGTRRIGGLVIIMFMLVVLTTGDYYIYSTSDTLNKISEKRDTWEYYEIITGVNSKYGSVDDITGETVYVTEMDSKQMNEARERIVTKADVEYVEEPDFMTVAKHIEIVDPDTGEAKASDDTETTDAAETESNEAEAVAADVSDVSQDNLILVSESQRKLINENIKGFNKSTKIIFKIKVKKRADDNSKAVDVTKDSFNVLISGLDSWGTIDEGGLSDVNMVMTVNPNTRQILLTSIPRDSYVPLHSSGQYDKLTHTGLYGEEETKATIEDLLDIDINYTVRINFSMFVDIIKAIGGVTVDNDEDFFSSVKGWHYPEGELHLNGKKALWFARERKSFTDGDMKRNENQQKVLKSVIKKVTSSKVILTRYTKILDAVEDEMTTTLTDKDMKALVKMQLKDMKNWKVETVAIKGATGNAPCYSMGGQELSVVYPDEETVEECKKKIHDVMYPVKNDTEKKDTKKNKDKENNN